MTTARELTTKAEWGRQCWPFRPLWQISVNRILSSNVNRSALAPVFLGWKSFLQQKWASLTCILLIRTRLHWAASHTFRMIITTQYSAVEWHQHVLALHPPGVNSCCYAEEQMKTALSDGLLRTHETGTVLSASSTLPAQE